MEWEWGLNNTLQGSPVTRLFTFYLIIENSHNNIMNMMITISFGFTFVFMYSVVAFLGENFSYGSTSVSFIFLFYQECIYQVLLLLLLRRSESLIVSEVRGIMSLSLAPAPVSDRSSKSPPTRELFALSCSLHNKLILSMKKVSFALLLVGWQVYM